MTVSPAAAATVASADGLMLSDRFLAVPVGGGQVVRCHYLWLRDNCWCAECRVAQTQERRLLTAGIPADIAPASAVLDEDGALRIRWNDNHVSAYTAAWLSAHDYSQQARAGRRHEPKLWDASFEAIPTFEHDAVLGSDQVQIAYLDAIRDYGVALVRHTPSVPGEVERFADKIGHVRETAFERIHNVRHDPTGYSVAHTPAELIPHTDLPGYHWPPSIQLLHFLVNEATGGESTVTDGWAVLADLRAQDRAAFDTLCTVPVPFQVFSDDEDTFATAPLVQLDTDGRIQTFRFSNHLVQPLDTSFEHVEPFYAAYRKLGLMITGDQYKVAFKTSNGDLLTVHGHRVLHGRLSFDPTSGPRHLQDAYMDYDDLMARSWSGRRPRPRDANSSRSPRGSRPQRRVTLTSPRPGPGRTPEPRCSPASPTHPSSSRPDHPAATAAQPGGPVEQPRHRVQHSYTPVLDNRQIHSPGRPHPSRPVDPG